jgi:hypothetical protein
MVLVLYCIKKYLFPLISLFSARVPVHTVLLGLVPYCTFPFYLLVRLLCVLYSRDLSSLLVRVRISASLRVSGKCSTCCWILDFGGTSVPSSWIIKILFSVHGFKVPHTTCFTFADLRRTTVLYALFYLFSVHGFKVPYATSFTFADVCCTTVLYALFFCSFST